MQTCNDKGVTLPKVQASISLTSKWTRFSQKRRERRRAGWARSLGRPYTVTQQLHFEEFYSKYLLTEMSRDGY